MYREFLKNCWWNILASIFIPAHQTIEFTPQHVFELSSEYEKFYLHTDWGPSTIISFK